MPEIKRLFLLPATPGYDSGYSIITKEDRDRYDANDADEIILSESFNNLKKLKNALLFLPPSAISLKKINFRDYGFVFIGDAKFIHINNNRLGKAKVVVRFHNLYLKVRNKYTIIQLIRKYGVKFSFLVLVYSKVEKRLLKNERIIVEVITKEDLSVAKLYSNNPSKISVHNFSSISVPTKHTNGFHSNRFVWFGGVSEHKRYGLEYFLNNVYMPLNELYPKIECWIYGRKTERYNNPERNIFGKGYYSGTDMPFKGKCIYINPDTDGLGIKVKLKDLIEYGYSFISTPEGYSGYSEIQYSNKIIAPLESWRATLQQLINDETNNSKPPLRRNHS